MICRKFALFALFVLAAQLAQAAGGFAIQINAGSDLAANQEALDAFQRAADEWAARITSSVTIRIDADLRATDQSGSTFSSEVIGATSIASYGVGYSDLNLPFNQVRDLMAARANGSDNQVLGYLPTSQEVNAMVPARAAFDNTTLGVLRANQRALGLLAEHDTRADGTILFNSAFMFDYNRFDANGVAPSLFDFQTAAAHEIGHLLGFVSDVDDFDQDESIPSDNLTTLDLFRFPAAHAPSNASEFRLFARELRPGVDSLFGDLSHEYAMSTGANSGDGNQAGHWQDDFLEQNGNVTFSSLIGIMDPTLPPGTFEVVGDADFRAIELIGYEVTKVVPEPSALWLVVSGLGVLGGRCSRNRIVSRRAWQKSRSTSHRDD